MSGEAARVGSSHLERLDLALATRFVAGGVDTGSLHGLERNTGELWRLAGGEGAFIAALLRLRGLLVFEEDVAQALGSHPCRLAPAGQEAALSRGLDEALRRLRTRSESSLLPDGWFVVELYQALTRELPRRLEGIFRAERPWDAEVHVSYPEPEELHNILAVFDAEHRYRDFAKVFDALHPVRQAFRVFWRLCRVAPFADHNVPLGWLTMCAYLLGRGYPAFRPDSGDPALVRRLLTGPPPQRVLPWEARLLATVTGS